MGISAAINRFLMPVLIAGGLGPLTGGLAAGLLAVGTSILIHMGLVTGTFPLPHAGLSMADVFELLAICIVFAYPLGGVIALLAGLLISIWMIWRPPSVFVVVAAAVIASAVYMGIGASFGLLGPAAWSNAAYALVFAVIAVISAFVCWLLVRRFLHMPALFTAPSTTRGSRHVRSSRAPATLLAVLDPHSRWLGNVDHYCRAAAWSRAIYPTSTKHMELDAMTSSGFPDPVALRPTWKGNLIVLLVVAVVVLAVAS